MNLADRGELTGFLRKHGLSADKSLGQHFLCAPTVIRDIVSAASSYAGCLEVGPGHGVLTSVLAQNVQAIKAVEFDSRMLPLLADSAPECEVVLGDALKVDLGEILDRLPEPRVLVSNMPYYITGPLLDRFAAVRSKFDCAVLMMQKEVGQKILAKPKDRARGAISVCLQAEFEISLVCKVSPGSFMPPPKVESIVLKFIPKSGEVTTAFKRTVRAGFGQPRKTLINNFGATFRKERAEIAEMVAEAGFEESVRAFELSEADWLLLTEGAISRAWVI